MNARATLPLVLMMLLGCGRASAPPAGPVPPSSSTHANDISIVPTVPAAALLTASPLPFPGATGSAFIDLIAFERAGSRVWVPVGTGSVEVLDTASGTFKRVDGFKSEERDVQGKKRRAGPNAAAVGDGFVYVGDRATNEICAVDAKSLKLGNCLKLPSATDSVTYVATVQEVWVTMPKEQAMAVLDATQGGSLRLKTTIKLDGAPEGAATDDTRGLFFTNLEDKGPTLVLDVKTHKPKGTWHAGCGADGPRGLAFDSADDFLIVACTDHLQVLDAGHDGAPLGQLDTGAGVDNIDFSNGRVYAAAGKAAKLMVAKVDGQGHFTVIASGPTSEGARNAVADARGHVYVADSLGARLLEFTPPKGD